MKDKLKIKKSSFFVVGVVIVLAVVAIALIHSSESKTSSSGHTVYENGPDYPDNYSSDACRCLERTRPTCLEGFYYNETRQLCVNPVEKTVTFTTLRCSLFECSGVEYRFDNTNKEWGSEAN